MSVITDELMKLKTNRWSSSQNQEVKSFLRDHLQRQTNAKENYTKKDRKKKINV